MPGIAGIISRSGSNSYRAEHDLMVRTLQHESFYRTGGYSDVRLHIHVGWAVLPNSFSDCLPVLNERRDKVLFFSGENFSKAGGKPSDYQDARYLIRLYEEYGDAFLLELNGWFTGVLLDLNQQRVLLFNDRYGMEKLYFHETADALYFATEAKSILRALPALREINPEALAEQVAFDCVHGDKSLFKGISSLPGGSCWTFDPSGNCRKEKYFNPEMLESGEPVRVDDVSGRLEQVFADLLPSYFRSSQDVAISLTGGLDTRLIVAGMKDLKGLPAYTYAGSRDTFDVRQSRQVARASGLNYDVIRLGSDFFDNFPKLAEETVYISDGLHGVNGTHNLYFNRIARKIAPVRLTGLFGSEVLRQGPILPHAIEVEGLFSRQFLSDVHEAERRAVQYRKGNPLTAALHRDIPWRGRGSMSVEQSQVTMRSPFMDNELVKLLYGIPNSMRESKKVQQEMIRKLSPLLGSILSDRGDATDRNPLVLYFVRLFLWALFKADYIYYFEMPTWLLRMESSLSFLQVPRLVFGHQKFESYRIWYRDALPDFVKDILLDRRTLERPFFDAGFLRKAVNDHISGKKNYANQLEKALTLELVMRTLIDTGGPSHSRTEPLATVQAAN